MKNPNISQMISQFEEIYNSLNVKYFNGELPKAAITFNLTRKTRTKGYKKESPSGKNIMFEIVLGPEILHQSIDVTVSDILHEMVCEYCEIKNIKATSNNGTYHNKTFKTVAAEHGLHIERGDKYGWSITKPSNDLRVFVDSQGWSTPKISDSELFDYVSSIKSSTRRWVCPKCGTIIRSTKDVRVICADCMKLFVKANEA